MIPLRWCVLSCSILGSWLAAAAWSITSRTPDAIARPESLIHYSQFDGGGGGGGAYQRISAGGVGYRVLYGFRNFNQDVLTIDVMVPKKDVQDSNLEFGFRQSDLDAVNRWYHETHRGLRARTQDEVDRMAAALDEEYRKKRKEVYARAYFHYLDEHTVEPDVPKIVRRNSRRLAPISLAFARIAEQRDYGMEDLVGAVSAMAETSLRYKIPPQNEGGKVIDGMQPPPQTFAQGWGDCITKSALIGSILSNWPNIKMVGLGIPDHYLLAVHRIPAQGEVYVEYGGLAYIMIEAAGPAWIPPGQVGDYTSRYVSSGGALRIQPI